MVKNAGCMTSCRAVSRLLAIPVGSSSSESSANSGMLSLSSSCNGGSGSDVVGAGGDVVGERVGDGDEGKEPEVLSEMAEWYREDGGMEVMASMSSGDTWTNWVIQLMRLVRGVVALAALRARWLASMSLCKSSYCFHAASMAALDQLRVAWRGVIEVVALGFMSSNWSLDQSCCHHRGGLGGR